jgi:lysophospholipase L1-like esterase
MSKISLYLVGDSISIDYHPYLAELIADGYAYRRKGGLAEARRNLDLATGANGGDSACVLAHVQEMLAEGLPEKVVAVNCGLHDIKRKPDSGEIQVSQEAYRNHLKQIVALLHGAGKRMIWIRTTPVDEVQHRKCNGSFNRLEADLAAYNAIADAVMEEAGVDSLDLYGFTASLPDPLFRDHVHFFPEISRAQAGFIRREFDRLLRPDYPPLHTFLGDSITDAGRDRGDSGSLGEGYVQCLAKDLPQ